MFIFDIMLRRTDYDSNGFKDQFNINFNNYVKPIINLT